MMRIALLGCLAAWMTTASLLARDAHAARCTFQTTPVTVTLKEHEEDLLKKIQAARQARIDKAAASVIKANDDEVARVREMINQLAVLAGTTSTTVITTTATRMAVTLASPPPERLRLSFDSSAGLHHEVEWDPAVASELTRTIALEKDTWTISASAEPQKFSQQNGTVVIQIRFGGVATAKLPGAPDSEDVGMIDGTYSAVAIGASTTATTQAPIELGTWPRPRLTMDCNPANRQTIENTRFATTMAATAGGDGLRGFGVAPTFVTDTLAILAEIAIDRARAGALEIIKKRLVNPFCDKEAGVSLKRLQLGPSGQLALPRTCALLDSLRLDDVLASGRPLIAALRDDLRLTIAPAALRVVAPDDALVQNALLGVLSIANSAIDRGGFDGLEGQLMLELVSTFKQLGARATAPLRAQLLDRLRILLSSPGLDLAALADDLGEPCTAPCSVDDVVKRFDALLAQGVGAWSEGGTAEVTKLLLSTLHDLRTGATARVLITHAVQRLSPSRRGELVKAIGLCAGSCDDKLIDLLATMVGSGVDVNIPPTIDAAERTALVAALTAILRETAPWAEALRQLDTAIGYGCQARLVVAVIKRCSGGACTASDVGLMLERPQDFFAYEDKLPYGLCWRSTTEYLQMPDGGAAMQRLVLDGLKLIAPVVDGQGRDRAKAAVRLTAQILRRLHRGIDGASDQKLDAFVELAIALIDEDYGTAFGRFVHLTGTLQVRVPRELRRFAELIGAVASYAAVYRSTNDEDPKVARDARKRALSSIIDSFTNRTEREKIGLWSLGSNVGVGINPLSSLDDAEGHDRYSPSVRVPLGVRIEWLSTVECRRWWGIGVFGGAQLFDLGLFVREDKDGGLAPIEWADFVAPGIELGISHSCISRPLNLSAHLSYAPSHEDDDATADAGVWRLGFSLAYYVPFLDLD